MDVGEPHVTAAEADGELGVIHAQQVQHGGVQIVDLEAFIDCLVAVLVGAAVDGTAFHAATGHPEAKPKGVMVAAVISLRKRRAAEFTHPDKQRTVEQAAGFEVGQKRGDGLVDGLGIFFVAVLEPAVLIPAIAIAAGAGELNEPHAALHQPAGDEAVAAECAGVAEFRVEAVILFGLLGLALEIHQLRHGRLHAEGQFLICDGRFDLVQMSHAIDYAGVEFANEVQLVLLQRGSSLGAADVGDWFVAILEDAALVGRGQKAVGKTTEPAWRYEAAIEHDEARQILVGRAQAVVEPRAHARSAHLAKAGVQKIICIGMFGERGSHRADHA